VPTSKSIAEHLDAARRDLLDLGLRNTLLNYQLRKSRGVRIVDTTSAEVVQWLLTDRKSLEFAPQRADGQLEFAPRPEEADAQGRASSSTRPILVTLHNEANLHSRLLGTYYAARTHLEERGVNILFMALGMLHWFEDEKSEKELTAPLLLVPVALDRTSAREKFKLSYNDEEVEGNLSLAAKLESDFRIEFPELADTEEVDVGNYFDRVARSVEGQKRWRVEPNEIALGFFSFAKFLMYRDLEPANWCTQENPDATSIVASLVRDGFRDEQSSLPDDTYLDRVIAPDQLSQVIEADGSQALAMLDVRAGKNLVIQGPPGTGKSQTITNLIADALGQGKKVLFVAEKIAALEVVKRRLGKAGLGDACLELHSYAANKKAVLAELQRTMQLGPPGDSTSWELDRYKQARDALNAYCVAVNTPIGDSGYTPYKLMGELVRIERSCGGASLPAVSPMADAGGGPRDIPSERSKVERFGVLVDNLQTHLSRMGPAQQNPFHATKLVAILPSDRHAIAASLDVATQQCKLLEARVKEIAGSMGIAAACTRSEADLLGRAARRALTAPHLRGVQIKTGDWQAKRDQIAEVLKVGTRYAAVRAQFDPILIPEAWDQSLLTARQTLSTVGRKWWRWLSGDFRRTRNFISGLCAIEQQKDVETQLRIVDAIMEAARLRKTIQENDNLGTLLYGVQWQGLRSDWTVLERLTQWIVTLYRDVGDGKLPSGIVDFLAGNPVIGPLAEKVQSVETAIQTYDKAIPAVFEGLDLEEAARAQLVQRDLAQQGLVFAGMAARLDELQDAITFNNLKAVLLREGLGWVIQASWDWPGAGKLVKLFFQKTCFEALLRKAYSEREALRTFNGEVHQSTRDRFRELDIGGLRITRLKIARAHYEGLPSPNAYGQVGVLLREFQKRSRHLPIRKLVQQAGNAIQAIKPVFMMSPMSISAFVPQGSLNFDLVVFDEASQVRPVDAFGAVLRGKQVVVVGDSKQLPPTSFFDALIGVDDVQDDEVSITTDIESLLGLMAAQGAPERMLRWHYRSRHQSLIAISNERFYDNRLVVFPSPDSTRRGLGLVFHHLPNTVYDRGGTRTNPKEAEIVAKAVMAHARLAPQLTLGVAAFSLQQAEAILDQLEQLRREDPSLESFFASRSDEPFFVKNLESVQGDERDVIFISVGYGRNAEGYVTMNFGALTVQGGERRLNVLITRARQCCEVFTNLTHDDIDLARTSSQGVAALKAFLKYAQTRVSDVPQASGGEEDSPFEREVAEALRAAGHHIVHQVGSGGFRIDLAVTDPEKPGRYILGIECDGAAYHSSRSARDRDRLRQDVLENLGWQMYRVWSTDWFHNSKRELQKLLGAIHQAKLRMSDSASTRQATQRIPADTGETPIERSAPFRSEIGQGELRAEPYETCTLRVSLGALDLHEIPSFTFAEWIEQVVRVEGPVHPDEVVRRICDAAGVRRIGNRIESAFTAGVRAAVRGGHIVQREEFLSIRGGPLKVRDRSALPNASRKLELVAPEEIEEAVLLVARASMGIDIDDVPTAVCRLVGFARTTEEMTSSVVSIVKKLASSGKVQIDGGHVRVADSGGAQTGLRLVPRT
jgi:very-short-patch-repair endonuclease